MNDNQKETIADLACAVGIALPAGVGISKLVDSAKDSSVPVKIATYAGAGLLAIATSALTAIAAGAIKEKL